jgi:hypothetical protein
MIAFSVVMLAACVAGQAVAQDAALEKLSASLQALRATSSSTAEGRDRITSEILALAEGTHQPSLSAVVAFTSGLTRALAGIQLSDSQVSRIATTIDTVLHSAGVGNWRLKGAVADLPAVLSFAGLDYQRQARRHRLGGSREGSQRSRRHTSETVAVR